METKKSLKVNDQTTIAVKTNAIVTKRSKLLIKPEAEYDGVSMIMTGGLIEDFAILLNSQRKKGFVFVFCCIRAYGFITRLQKEKHFSNEDVLDIFRKSEFDIKKCEKMMKFVYDYGKAFSRDRKRK